MPFDDEPTPYDLPEPPPEADRLAREVIGAAIEVHKHLGSGHLEATYANALALEMAARKIPFQRELPVDVRYKGALVGAGKLDFLVSGLLVVEIKAVAAIAAIHRVQVDAYLAMMRLQLGLILNFNVLKLKDGGIVRIIRTGNTDSAL